MIEERDHVHENTGNCRDETDGTAKGITYWYRDVSIKTIAAWLYYMNEPPEGSDS